MSRCSTCHWYTNAECQYTNEDHLPNEGRDCPYYDYEYHAEEENDRYNYECCANCEHYDDGYCEELRRNVDEDDVCSRLRL